ncbi:hypothetical protein GWZ74_17055 [Vibrio cholerae]|uniref:hypothetical protein n=1 Tax=Vibrio cholerae TaxID=666 RepID=UPI000F406322|nr:hypothetical protein [Vibrio cholerae]NOE85139.1 hypothetical protein [Vibrio cholerae]NOE97586.1 hypothetical protein [Vibrio cholerae]NOE98033.1 hypothetical protein [Vibrio cholerae]NOF13788.1 hypothetical protein [Vibrio cholerae]NOF18556.1 hypothetical protein [Vibrio cholerae]
MHKLQNGSQVSVRPPRKPLVGLGGYFSESNDQGAPSYPGQDWFNDCTDEFINALNEMGITYDQEQLDHLARAFAAVRSQEWNANVNYGIGQEVVRNGLRYIARAASGPDNGGAITPESDSGLTWNAALPAAYSIKSDTINEWLKIAVIDGNKTIPGDFLWIDVVGGSERGDRDKFSAEIIVSERADIIKTIVTPKTIAPSANPEFYTKRISFSLYELWIRITTPFPAPVTIIRKSQSRNVSTVSGILETSSTAPTGTALVPYDTGYQFASIPIGMEVAFDTPPPTNDPRFRFVKLTADDAYNGSLLNNKVISGTAPNLVVKMTVNSALSPINGQQIEMLNTMGAIPTPGLTSGAIIQDAMRNIAGTITTNNGWMFNGATGPFNLKGGSQVLANATTPSGGSVVSPAFDFDASRQVPTAERFQSFGVSRVFYKRVY